MANFERGNGKHPGVPIATELNQPSLRARVLDRIINKKPIILGVGQLGDSFINYSVYNTILTKLCREEGIRDPRLPLKFWTKDLFGQQYFDLDREVGSVTKDITNETSNRYQRMMQMTATALEVKLDPIDLMRIPEPQRYNWRPMEDFDRDAVIQQGEAIRHRVLKGEGNGKFGKIIVIAQGGSVLEKRFTDYQVGDISRIVRSEYPDAYIVVVTDNQRATDHTAIPSYASLANEVIPIGDINRIGGYFYAMDNFISTDTFFAWYGLGARAMKNDRSGIIQPKDGTILYTAADPLNYQIPGCTVVESAVILHARNLGKMRGYNGLLAFGNYEDYTRAVYGSSSTSIHPYDISRLTDQIIKQARA